MANFLRIAAVVREPLQVGDQDKLLVVMLQRDALAQRAVVVARLPLAGRAGAGGAGVWLNSRPGGAGGERTARPTGAFGVRRGNC